MALRLFLEFNKQVVQLPVNPEELTISTEAGNTTKTIVNLGQVNLLGLPELREIEFESFFPHSQDGPYVLTKGKFKDPQFYVDYFDAIMKSKKPARFIISDTKVNLLVSLEEFEYTREGGTNDIRYSLVLKEYRTHGSKVVVIKPATQSKPASSSTGAAPRPKPPRAFAIGDTIIANGRFWSSSYGDGPFGTFNNFTGKIHLIVADKTRKYRFHITTPSGGWMGWVNESQIKHP